MKIGDYQVREVTDGTFGLDGGAMFGVVPKVLWERQHPADARNRIQLSLRCLLVEGAGRRVLLDAGIGEKWSEKERSIYAIDHAAGSLVRSLGGLGVSAAEITDVVLSHLHFDHAGGLTRRAEGEIRLTFPNARVHVQREHWSWACAPSEKDRASFLPADFEILPRAGVLTLHEGPTEIAPGLEIRVGRGHTVGHQVVVVRGGDDALVFMGDTIPTAAHLRLPFVMGYDLYPLETIEEKRAVLAEIHDNGWILAFDHEPAFAACRLGRNEKGDYVVAERLNL